METKTQSTTSPATPDEQKGACPKNILVIKSASRVFNKVLDLLRAEFPKASFTILTANPEAMQNLKAFRVHHILPLSAGRRISLFSYGIKKRKHLRQQNFDLAVVLYNIEKGWGYANVESLAWSSGANELRGYFPNGSFKPLTAGAILKNTLREQTALGWVALNIVTAVLQLIVFGVGMAGEALLRRILSKPSSASETHRPK